MATAEQYADWIVRNKDKKGTPEFETVAQAYQVAKQQEGVAAQVASGMPAARREPERFTGFSRDVGPAMAMLSPEQKVDALKTGVGGAVGLAAGPVLAAGTRAAAAVFPVMQRVAAPLETAFRTGGFQTGLPAQAPRAAKIATRVVGGAVPGAIGGAVTGDAETGAYVGGGLALLAPPVAKIVSEGAGSVIDSLMGRKADTRANQLIRLAANDEVNALRAAMAANPDVPASRAAAQLNLPVLQALLQRAEKADVQGVTNAFRQRESQDVVNELTRLAGGPTAETARAVREKTKESLGELTGRMREEAFGAARRTGEVMPKLQTIATEARADAKKNVDLVRRVSDAINRADDWARNWVTESRLVEGPGGAFTRQYVTNQGVGEAGVRLGSQAEQRYTFPGQLAESGRQTTVGGPFQRQVIDEGGTIARRVDEAAQASLQAGARARAAENAYQSMVDRGLEPITIDKFTSPIDNLLSDPAIATNPTLKNALPLVRQMFKDWADEYGVVTPEALDAIRKNGVSGIIEQLTPGADSTSQSRLAAQVLAKLKPAIDEAIEKAGGKNWSNYLKSFERGMSDIRGMELADQVRKLYAKGTSESKQQIIDLVRGESPDAVEDLFGSGRYKISEEMAKDMPFLQKIADTLELDITAVKQAAEGRAALRTAEQEAGWRIRLPFFTRFTTATNEIIAVLERKMKEQTMESLIKAARSGRDFNKILDAIPTTERSAFLNQFKNAESWKKFSVDVANAARAYTVAESNKSSNALAPQQNSNALATR
jgi:hypothetical protein